MSSKRSADAKAASWAVFDVMFSPLFSFKLL
jgi:hypothetical protein